MNADLHIACQTITWGENQRDRFDEVFRISAEAGYTGLEIGFRHLQPIAAAKVSDRLSAHGLELVASHVGGNLQDRNQASGEQQMLDAVLDYLQEVGTHTLMYSGLRFEDDAQFEREFAALRDAANRCRDRGVQLLYHNHDWEFADDGRIINALLEVCGDELGFCPDIGWIVKGGADPVATLDRMGVRVGAIHFKDFASEKPDLDTVMLGEGIAPLKAAADWARKNRPGLWLIAEQDEADIAPEEAIRRNARFMQETVKSIGEDTQ